jgi:hypothetical protein
VALTGKNAPHRDAVPATEPEQTSHGFVEIAMAVRSADAPEFW